MSQTGSEKKPEYLTPGTIVADRYEILELIGRGAIGVVYKARHTFMDRIVAIKMLQQEQLSDDKTVARFQQEARAISNLNHPNIVTVFDFGLSNGQAFLVMDFIDGQNLDDFITEGGVMGVLECLSMFDQICEALKHAHEKGIIHRDLKPGNVVLLKGTDPVAIKLVDFGMAKLHLQADRKAQKITQPGDVFGSPYYMSPEQFAGGTLDERSDVYSLGCLFYEALTARPPHLGEDVMEVVHNHLNSLPESINDQVDEEVPPELEFVIGKMLAKKPEDRFQKVADVKFELQQISYRIRLERSRTRTIPMSAVAAATGGSGDDPTAGKQPEPETTQSKAARSSTDAAVREGSAPASDKSAGKGPGARRAKILGKVELAATIVLLAAIVAGAIFLVPKHEPTWSELDLLGTQALESGDLKRAEDAYMKAVALAEQHGEDDNPELPKSLAALGLVYHREKKYDLAEGVFTRAIEVMKLQPGYDCAQLSPLLSQLGKLYDDEGKQTQAEEVHRRAIAIINHSFGKAGTESSDCGGGKKTSDAAKKNE